MSLILIIADIAIILACLYFWKKYRDNNFLFVLLIGTIAVLIGLLNYIRAVPLGYSVFAFALSCIIMNLYIGKKFEEKKFFWSAFLIMIAILVGIYAFYMGDVNFMLPINEWSINSFFVAAVLVFAFIAALFL